MKCLACGSLFLTFEYQSRSADEAQTAVTTCPQCPLNALKLDVFSQPSPSHVHLKSFSRKQPKVQTIDSSLSRLLHMIIIKDNPTIKDFMEDAICYNSIDREGKLFRCFVSGPFSGHAIHESNKKTIGPGATIIALTKTNNATESGTLYSYFRFHKISDDEFTITYTNKIHYTMHILNSSVNLRDKMTSVYSSSTMFTSLYDYMSRSIVTNMSNLSARGHDAPSVDESEYHFAHKVDGERIWLSRIGMVWLYTRRNLEHKVMGWCIDSVNEIEDIANNGPVLDIEMLIGHPPVLIDVLMDNDGILSKRDRNTEWIYSTFKSIRTNAAFLNNIYVRELYSSRALATESLETSRYPCDGVVAIPKQGIDIVKLKPIKSIELRYTTNDTFVTSEDDEVFRCTNSGQYEVGAIYEIGIEILNETCYIRHKFRRPDKLIPNSSFAVSSIIESSRTPIADDAVRTYLWRWSNLIRSDVYERAYSTSPGKRIVLDIGTGDGQSTDSHIKESGCSFILVEPDEQKCKKLRTRLHIHRYEKDPRMLIRMVGALKSGKLRSCILNCTVEQLLLDNDVRSMLLPELKCVVACFSAQFVIDTIDTFVSSSVPFVGACYLYDGIGKGECIIDTGGIRMRKDQDDTAKVKWGRDVEYIEPAIESCDLPPSVTLLPAYHSVPLECPLEDTVLEPLRKSLNIILSRC